MSRILLADDSPHAQRMGERILREEGYEVVSVTDGNTAVLRLDDVDPDLIIADAFLPARSGFDICKHVKAHPRHQHVRVIMTAGLLEPFDEEEARLAGGDAIIKKPFEASAMLETIRPLVEEAARLKAARPVVAADPLADAPGAVSVKDDARGSVTVGEDTRGAVAASEPLADARGSVVAKEARPAIEEERVRAAVTVALDAAMPALVDEITEKVLLALGY